MSGATDTLTQAMVDTFKREARKQVGSEVRRIKSDNTRLKKEVSGLKEKMRKAEKVGSGVKKREERVKLAEKRLGEQIRRFETTLNKKLRGLLPYEYGSYGRPGAARRKKMNAYNVIKGKEGK